MEERQREYVDYSAFAPKHLGILVSWEVRSGPTEQPRAVEAVGFQLLTSPLDRALPSSLWDTVCKSRLSNHSTGSDHLCLATASPSPLRCTLVDAAAGAQDACWPSSSHGAPLPTHNMISVLSSVEATHAIVDEGCTSV